MRHSPKSTGGRTRSHSASITLAWSAPASDGGAAVSGYKIYRSTSSGAETFLTSLGNVGSYLDSTTANGTTYYYKATARNAIGESTLSNECPQPRQGRLRRRS